MKVLFGVRCGGEDWEEELITENESVIEKAKEWAIENGFDRLRVAEIDIERYARFFANPDEIQI